MNPGRNDPCPCGSGKKYKKCCIPQYDKPAVSAAASMRGSELSAWSREANFWMPEQLNPMSDEEIVSKLDELGIPVSRAEFVEDLRRTLDPGKVLELWRERNQPRIEGRDADFPCCAAMQLSRRWAPDLYSIDKLEEIVDRLGKRSGDKHVQERLDMYRLIWNQLKELYIHPMGLRSLDHLNQGMETMYDFDWVVSDYEHELRNASIGRNEKDRNALLEERVAVCKEMLELLPDTDTHNLLNLHRDIAESYELMKDYAKAEQLYEQLTKKQPDWVWGYVGWGDMYNGRGEEGDRGRAEAIYRLGLERCREDRDVLEERL
jgi:tetratricopeptide (TPR) repeat protein